MTKTQFRLGVLVILAAILLHNLTSPDRYKVISSGTVPPFAAVLVDGVTGKTWLADDREWEELPHK